LAHLLKLNPAGATAAMLWRTMVRGGEGFEKFVAGDTNKP
jgi:hypothetical protein